MGFTLQICFYKSLMAALKMVARFIPHPKPNVYIGPDSSQQLCNSIGYLGARKVLIVTDAVLEKMGMLKPMIKVLEENGIASIVYSGVLPDPTYTHVEDGLALLKQHACDAVLAVGGGSSIDTAKVIAVRATNKTPVHKLAGILKVKQAGLPLYTVPTTAGTGSEVTVAAVVSEPDSHQKTPIIDPKIVPKAAALDPKLMTGLPAPITAATGMDALTHTIEAYISRFADAETDALAEAAVKLILEYLPKAYKHGEDLQAREAMAVASYYAGLAFSRTNLGYVHAIAHQLGARYQVPHGLANAIVLPHILEFSQDAVAGRLARLALLCELGAESDTDTVLSEKFIERIKGLCQGLALPTTVEKLNKQDIDGIVKDALKEAHYLYPVPKYMNEKQCRGLVTQMLP